MSAARYIGRVGGLAVAFGVGTAVLTGYGVASADSTSSGSESSYSSPASSDGGGSSAPSGSTSAGDSTGSESSDSASASDGDDAAADDSNADAADAAAADAADEEAAEEPAAADPAAADAAADEEAAEEPAAAEEEADSSASGDAAVIQTAALATPFLDVVDDVVNSADGPAAPPAESPLGWAAAAAARRELALAGGPITVNPITYFDEGVIYGQVNAGPDPTASYTYTLMDANRGLLPTGGKVCLTGAKCGSAAPWSC